MSSSLNNTEYNFIIIGGGASGSGIALDTSSRGYKVLLLESNDFASGTSSKSSKLIHGGVRYLEKAVKQFDIEQYNLVKEGLKERAIFLKNAPHLAKRLKLDTPVYSYLEAFYIYTGLFLYKLIAGNKSIGGNYFLNNTVLSLLQPSLKKDKLKGAISFYDGRFLDSRMVIALLQTAKSFSCEVKNYSEVKNFTYDEQNNVNGVIYFDKQTNTSHEVKAQAVINATGTNVDNIRLLDDKKSEDILSLSSGIHIVVPKRFLPFDEGILIPKTQDGRIIFILPYLDKCLIGTTDNEVEYTSKPKALEKEVEYLISHVNDYFELRINTEDVLSSWSGIRPLVKSKKSKSTQQVVREHLITSSKNGLISISGGKWTTYRKMAEQLVDYAIKKKNLEVYKPCQTKKLKVVGSNLEKEKVLELMTAYDVSKYTKENLVYLYGDKAIDILECAKEYDAYNLIHDTLPYIQAEVIYCIKHEFVKEPIDFISRRILLSFVDKKKALDCVEKVCEIMTVYFEWDNILIKIKETKKEIEELF